MWAVPEVDLRGADHVPDGDAAVLAAGHHHAVAEPELKAEHQRSGCGEAGREEGGTRGGSSRGGGGGNKVVRTERVTTHSR